MAVFHGEIGLQFVTHLANQHTLPELVRFAARAHELGFAEIWVNDNLRYRSQLVVLTAIAARVPVRVGTAILVPYFHNPMDVADALATLSELCDGRAIDVGIARGDLGQSPQHMEIAKPIAMVRETAGFLRRALAGEEVAYRHYPVLRDYYHLQSNGKFRLAFQSLSPFRFYGGGNGPQSLGMCGRAMDGLISSGTFIPMLRCGRLAGMLARADEAARKFQPGKRLRRICELNVSVSRDRKRAIDFPKRQVAHSILQWEALGLTADEYAALNVDRSRALALQAKFAAGATVEEASSLVEESMVRAYYAAGTPEEAGEQILDLARAAGGLHYDQIAFAKLGPDYGEAIDFLATEILPALR